AALTLGGCGTLVEAVPTVPSATLPPEAVGLPADAVPGPSADRASGTGAGAHEPLEAPDVVDLVARMDAVLTEGTEDDWAAFFEGEELVEQQRRWFRAVREVPMDVRELLPDAVVERDAEDGTVVQLVLAH